MSITFHLDATDGHARAGRLVTPHGEVLTPIFMPVGTRATVKGMYPWDLEDLGAPIILANTYHLMQRPGAELIDQLGGLHTFMSYPGAILTDSGGYQVYSLAKLRKVTADGVSFRSHLDGSLLELTPEVVVAAQHALGSDIMMPLDVCPPWPAATDELRRAVDLTRSWAERSLSARDPARPQALFGIVQGGVDTSLRGEAARSLVDLGFNGYALGGLSVGEPRAAMVEAIAAAAEELPVDRPRYLMGSGTPGDIMAAVAEGVDMFDVVLPTRNARNGQAFTSEGRIDLRNLRFREDQGALDPACGCAVCKTFSRAYLRHLVTTKEMLGALALSRHNLWFFLDMMRRLRQAIKIRQFERFRREFGSSCD